MEIIREGDVVVRRSYRGDIIFRVVKINSDGIAELKACTLRLAADAPLADLVIAGPEYIRTALSVNSCVVTETQSR